MQAILKSKHEHFRGMVNEIKTNRISPDAQFIKLEDELEESYQKYVKEIDDLKITIIEYRIREKMLRNKIKELILSKQAAIVMFSYCVLNYHIII